MGKAPPGPRAASLSPQDSPRPSSRAGWGQRPLREGAGRGGAGHLHAVVVGALPVEVAAVVVDAAVVQRAEAHEAVLQGVVPLLVHVVVPDHVLLAGEPLPGEGPLAAARPACWPGPSGLPTDNPAWGRGSRLPQPRPAHRTLEGTVPKVPGPQTAPDLRPGSP